MRIASAVVAATMAMAPVTVTYIPTVGDTLRVWTGTESVEVDPAAHFTHHCHEDEAQVVTPFGLACVPVDNITDLRPEQFDGMRVLGEDYSYARP